MRKLWKIAIMLVVLVMTVAVSDCEDRTGDTGQNGGDKPGFHVYYQDSDNDGYGNDHQTIKSKTRPAGYSDMPGDCDDNNAEIHPGAEEKACGLKDMNCDGVINKTIRFYSTDELDGSESLYNNGWAGTYGNIDFDSKTISEDYYPASGWSLPVYTFQVPIDSSLEIDKVTFNLYQIEEPKNTSNCTSDIWLRASAYYAPNAEYIYWENCNRSIGGILSPSNCYFLPISMYYKFTYTDSYDLDQQNWWHIDASDFLQYVTRHDELKAQYVTITTSAFCKGWYAFPSVTFEDGGNHGGTGNLPYLEITCK